MLSCSVSKPSFTLPPLACDAHCHVFGPGILFPYSAARKYTPEDAPKEQLVTLHKKLGVERSVLVQASCHGTDNRAMLDALNHSKGRYRGVAVIDEGFTQADLLNLHTAGVRGIRFNFLSRLVEVKPREYYLRLAERIAPLGWHVVVYFEAGEFAKISDLLWELPLPLVIDHMGRPDVSQSLTGDHFQQICGLLTRQPENCIKVSCIERLTKIGAPYRDVIPFAKYLVERFPDQVLWGTDWPHPNMAPDTPDDVLLVDAIPLMAIDQKLQNKLLVANPHRLYGFDDG